MSSYCEDSDQPVTSTRIRKKRKPSKLVACLVSCVVFLVIVCACLIAVLVLIGRHILYNSPSASPEQFPSRKILPLAERSFKRLPNDTRPILYDLTLLPDLIRGLYKGFVNITLEVDHLRKDLVVHSKGLSISEIVLINSQGRNIQILKVNEIEEDQVIVITTQQRVLPGVYYLFVRFDGRMFDKLTGLYRINYTKGGREVRQIATSKFEPTYARQAFPCFDEPNLKARYKVHLVKPKDYIALSNYPVSNTTDYDDKHHMVSFEETVSMSTYLSCFIVSDFTHTENSFESGGKTIPLKVYASPDNLNKTTYAGEVGKKAIEYYINYFNIPYPLPKLDMVAIPDFVSGAMEHWGLVTYRETALLYTDTTHSSANKQRVATVVAHELAHSWFGNLVTMDWWNDLWLNEGFASYIEYKGVHAAEPTWGMLDQFLTGDLHTVLNLDSTLSSHPIVQTVLTPDQITEIFDTISYNKGAAVLRMLEATVGEANFQKGVTNYLNKYAFSNAVTKDFLNEVQEVVGSTIDVTEMMDTFTVQMGYPVLTVEVSGDTYTLTQKRFLKDPSATYNESDSVYKYKWTVPVSYITDLGKSNLILFKYDAEKLTIQKPSGAKWIKFNYDQIGYYRVNYPLADWQNLMLYYPSLNTSDRTHLLEESFSLAEAGLINYDIPLSLSKNLTNERHYLPWNVANSKLNAILNYLSGSKSDQEGRFKSYIGKIVTPAYEEMTWIENAADGHLNRLARIEVLNLACAVNQTACLTEAQNQFNNWIQTQNPLSQDLRALIYKYGMRNANQTIWEKLLEVYKTETDASEKLKLINGLAYVDNEILLSRLIELAKDETVIRSQDYFTVLQYISVNPTGTEMVWSWVQANWDYLVNRFTLNDRYLGSLMPAITSRFATEAKLTEMKTFFAKYPEAGAGKANRAKALETVQNNIRWLSNYKSSVETWVSINS